MIATDKLYDIINKLRYPEESTQCDELLSAIRRTVENDTYTNWVKNEEAEGIRCHIPDEKAKKIFDIFELLDENGDLGVKINPHRGKFLLTDGIWVNSKIRTFAFTDESELLLNHIEEHNYDKWADFVIDPATGSGNHSIGLDGDAYRMAFDINPRAIAYSTINSIINGISKFTASHNDVRTGIPTYTHFLSDNMLFVINMPFALDPSNIKNQGYLPLHSNGGLTGANKTFAALLALKSFSEAKRQSSGCRAVVLCYSVGNLQEDRWEVVEYAHQLFGKERVAWTIQEGAKMWRVNGKKEEPNPMNLAESLPKKSECRFYIKDKDKEDVYNKYIELANQLNEQGWDHLGYGIVDIDLS